MAQDKTKPTNQVQECGYPDVYDYLSYRVYLKDRLTSNEGGRSSLSMSALARQVGTSTAYISLILSGKRRLSAKVASRIKPVLGLDGARGRYFEWLIVFADSADSDKRAAALAKMARQVAFRKRNPREFDVHEYLSHWYFVALREATAIPGFRLEDLAEMQGRLVASVELRDLRRALRFLTERGFLKREKGRWLPDERQIDCSEVVLGAVAARFHVEMLELAAHSIEAVPREDRAVMGHTFSLSSGKFDRARKIVEDAIHQIRDLESGECSEEPDTVYQLEMALFPLVKGSGK